MRKLYALLAGLFMSLAGSHINAQSITPDVANFSFSVNAPDNLVVFTNTSTIGSAPGLRKAFWSFGDGTGQMTLPLQGTQHHYAGPGSYTVCLRIYRYNSTGTGDSALTAQICRTVVIEANCRADFERLPPTTANNPLSATFRALPWHNGDSRPIRICWTFGDGRDTCIQYSNTNPGPYVVTHNYTAPGLYEVCVRILYQGGCEAQKCKPIEITRPDSCRADFERLALNISSDPLTVGFKAIPWHNNNKKPTRICWEFGDGRDTCINYPTNFTGLYLIYHRYLNAGLYEVCVKIQYQGGCEARKCKPIQVGRPDTCRADFERLPLTTIAPPHLVYYKALPWHNNNKKPQQVCWQFGDGSDTCINYTNSYTGNYAVSHRYNNPGLYEVCVKITYFGGCEARKCKPIQIGPRPDTCHADFERLPLTTSSNPLNAVFKALPSHNNNKKPQEICWRFGDGRDTCITYSNSYTGNYLVEHRYNHPGLYEVCVKITYFGGCEARKCKPVQIGPRPDSCRADFERLPLTISTPPHLVYYKALPWHNNNKKPQRVCWQFGDGTDTCINYTNSYTGNYAVSHRYQYPGLYDVCVKITYFGGCEARKCKPIQVGRPDTCRADFERLPITTSNSPLHAIFKALPSHNNDRKPSRICWQFGDGSDTCINYPQNYTGLYLVNHRYEEPGLYEVCVRILYYGGCEARKCKPIQIARPDSCRADFERIPVTASNTLLHGFRALPWHNNNKKPQTICWRFGDGTDTCITYPVNYTGQYVVTHRYLHPGEYEVCVKIEYYGGCDARKCRTIVIPPPTVHCTVRLFEITPSINSLVRGFFAVPNSVPERRPERICWSFGDGEDTCIMINPNLPLPNFFIRHTYPGPGVYRACVRVVFQGGCVAEDCREVVIRNPSNVCGGFMVDSLVAPRTFKFRGYSIHNPNDEVISYRWTFGDGTSALGREVTHTYTQGGTFEVCLYIRTRLGCETRICKPVRAPGNNLPTLHLAPNPVVNVVNVTFFSTHTEQIHIRILNGIGTQVRTYTRNVNVGTNTWNHELATLLPGVYSYIVQSPNQLASVIFIKQ